MRTFSLLFLLVAALLCNSAYAQSTLEPCNSEFLSDYYIGVDKIIDSAVGRSAQLQLTTLPSFQPESGVRLVGTDIYFVQFELFYWGEANYFDKAGHGHMDFSKPRIATKVHHAPLSPELVQRIKDIYAEAIAGVKESERLGLDGVSYRFSMPQTGCGEAWSPEADSPNDRLVGLLSLLEKHARLFKPRDLQRSEESIALLLHTISSH